MKRAALKFSETVDWVKTTHFHLFVLIWGGRGGDRVSKCLS